MTQVFNDGVVLSTIYNSADVTKIVTLSTSTMTSGVTSSLVWSGAASVMTFPSGTSTVATTTLAQTMTNKTLNDATNDVRANRLATSVAGSPVTITLSVPVAGQALLTTSATAAAYTTMNLAQILTIGNTTGSTNMQFTGSAQLVLTTTNNIITSSPTVTLAIKAGDSVAPNSSGAAVTITGGTATGNGNGGTITIITGKVGTGTAGSIVLDSDTNGTGASTNGAIELKGHLVCDYSGLPSIARVAGAGVFSISPDSNDTSGNISAGPGTTVRVTYSKRYAGSSTRVIWSFTGDTGAGNLSDKFGIVNDSGSFFEFSNGSSSRTVAVNYWVTQR